MARRHLHRNAARKLTGDLCDISVNRLLMLCRGQHVTGTLSVDSWGHQGRVVFSDGEISQAEFGALHDHDAIRELSMLRVGMFALHSQQQVSLTPSQSSAPGASAEEATYIVDPTLQPAYRTNLRPTAVPPPLPAAAMRGAAAHTATRGRRDAAPASQASLTQQWMLTPALAGLPGQSYRYNLPMPVTPARSAVPAPVITFAILCLTLLGGIVAVGM